MDELVEWLASRCDNEAHQRLWRESATVDMRPDPSSDSGDRILLATAPLRKGLRLPVPPACVLTEDRVRESEVGKALVGLDRYTLFAFFLLAERRKGKASEWAPYINVLPTDIAFHPITFCARLEAEPELAAALEAEPLLKRALVAQHEKLAREFQIAQRLVVMHAAKGGSLGEVFATAPTMEEFVWASCMVVSRAFEMKEPNVMCMLPFADSMNHTSRDPTVQWRPRLPRGFFVVTLLRDVEANTELTANYHGGAPQGQASGLDQVRQFVMYGFVETDAFAGVRKAAARTS